MTERRSRKDRADVLLVYPVWVRRGGRGKLQRMLPPLSLLSMASCLEEAGFEVFVVDLHTEEMGPRELGRLLTTLRPRVVGITALSPHIRVVHGVARLAKELVPDVRVYVGGVHAEVTPEQMLRNPCIDAVCRGDGEETIVELARGVPHAEVRGLSTLVDGRPHHNPPRPTEMDLDRFPFPAYHLVDLSRYSPPAGMYRQLPAVNAIMTRGCPGKCTFCNSALTPLRSRSPERLVEMFRLLRDRYGVRQVNFYDDTFTSRPREVRRLCELMISERLGISWLCYVRGDFLSEEMATLMARAGCHQVLIGVETGSDALAAEIGKPIPKERYRKTVELAHAAGMEVRASFIIGHLGETRETLEETLQFAMELDVDFLQLSVLTPYPGTRLFQEARERGLLIHEDFERYGQNEVVLRVPGVTPEEILRFERRAMLRFYLRPRGIWLQLRRLRRFSHLADLVQAFRVVALEGLGRVSPGSRAIEEWLEIEPGPEAGPDLSSTVHLTMDVHALRSRPAASGRPG